MLCNDAISYLVSKCSKATIGLNTNTQMHTHLTTNSSENRNPLNECLLYVDFLPFSYKKKLSINTNY